MQDVLCPFLVHISSDKSALTASILNISPKSPSDQGLSAGWRPFGRCELLSINNENLLAPKKTFPISRICCAGWIIVTHSFLEGDSLDVQHLYTEFIAYRVGDNYMIRPQRREWCCPVGSSVQLVEVLDHKSSLQSLWFSSLLNLPGFQSLSDSARNENLHRTASS